MKLMKSLILISSFLFSYSGFSQDMCKTVEMGVRTVYDIFTSQDLSGLSKYIEEDFVIHSSSTAGEQGLNGLKKSLEITYKAFPDAKMTITDIVVSPDGKKVAVLYNFTGTNTGEIMGSPATNKKVDVMCIDYLLFSDNYKAKEFWGYYDYRKMMEQLKGDEGQ